MIHSHLRMSGKWRVRDADWPIPAQHVAGHPHAGEARRPDQRPGARADDRRAAPASTSGSRASARTSSPPSSTRTAILRRLRDRRPDPPDRRRAARPAGHRRHREPVEGRGLLRGRDRPVAAHRRRLRRGGPARSSTPPARGCRSPRCDGMQDALQGRLRPRGPAVPALRGALEHPRTRAGRRQPDDILVSTMSAMRMRRIGHKGADLIVPGNTPASFDAALAHGVDMIEFDVLPEHQHEPDKGRLLLAHDYEHVEQRAHAGGGPGAPRERAVRRRRARRRPQAPRLRAARRRRAARARPDRAHADLLELDALADRAARARAASCASATRSRA